jgi:hypothetical protein
MVRNGNRRPSAKQAMNRQKPMNALITFPKPSGQWSVASGQNGSRRLSVAGRWPTRSEKTMITLSTFPKTSGRWSERQSSADGQQGHDCLERLGYLSLTEAFRAIPLLLYVVGHCHPERSEGSAVFSCLHERAELQIPRCARDDKSEL